MARVLNVDKNPAYPAAARELKALRRRALVQRDRGQPTEPGLSPVVRTRRFAHESHFVSPVRERDRDNETVKNEWSPTGREAFQ